MIASYRTGFLISGTGFCALVAANSRCAAFGDCGRAVVAPVVTEDLAAGTCDRHAAVAAMSSATAINAQFNSRFMESLHSS
ncbi:MAG TPA: hypothetical protein VN838_13985 [Bradyrhizobium sp.]|nr:hypothetical protein [Bradyrhizobium sp.]